MNATQTLLAERDALRWQLDAVTVNYGKLESERDALRAERDKLRAALLELRGYADLKLHGHRQDYDEEHCMVQTALRMIALADDALR